LALTLIRTLLSGSALMLFLSSFCCANFFGLADPNGWGELIQIAAPDVLSNAAKQEMLYVCR
jgi:hypothetical protein